MKKIENPSKYFVQLIDDFSNFILKRNAIDMALGIIIGMAFGRVVSSLVNDIIMPPIGIILAGVNFADLKIILKKAISDNSGKILQPEVAIQYGKFIQVLIDFLIVAFSTFVIIKVVSRFIRSKETEASLDWTEFIKKQQ
jgi:large conductance mechanosensitive channel